MLLDKRLHGYDKSRICNSMYIGANILLVVSALLGAIQILVIYPNIERVVPIQHDLIPPTLDIRHHVLE
jgi:hypothetical protein